MFNFHKPRVYRSADGCCICRAKSSSSRFTASRKYEKESMQCFNLHEPRNGEICNACVLLVKRYKRLPVGNKRHWGHVVDARAGPGTKSLAKQKKRENEIETKSGGSASCIPEKFAKIFKKNRKGKITAATAPQTLNNQQQQHQQQLLQQQQLRNSRSPHSEEQPSDSNESYDDEQQQLGASAAATPYQTRKRTAAAALATATAATTTSGAAAVTCVGSDKKRLRQSGSKRRRMLEPMKHRRAVDNVPFFEEHDLLRLDVCCGTVFQSLTLGSSCYIIDPEFYKPCEKHLKRRLQQQQQKQKQQQLQSVLESKPLINNQTAVGSQSISTPALKKHHLFFKRQSESFPQGEIHRISPIPLNKTESMPTPMPTTAATVQQQQHSTSSSSLSLVLKPGAALAVIPPSAMQPGNIITTTAVGAASPSSLSSSSNCSTSSSVATKFNDNSSDSGFDEHVLDRKSVSPPTQDELHLDKKLRGGSGRQRLILASGLPLSGQAQNLVLTGNEFTARFVPRQQAPAHALKINVLGASGGVGAGAGAAASGATTTITTTGSQSNGSGSCNKMRAIFNNANTIQHENGVTTILPASSLAASNQTAAMNAIVPSTVTITPAKKANGQNSCSNSNGNATATATATATLVANPKFILLKPAIAKFSSGGGGVSQTPTEVKIA